MNDDQFSAILTIVVPPVIQRIVERLGVDETEATKMFYTSKVYEWLSKEDSKTWHLSPLTLCRLFEQEQRGEELDWPEEAA